MFGRKKENTKETTKDNQIINLTLALTNVIEALEVTQQTLTLLNERVRTLESERE